MYAVTNADVVAICPTCQTPSQSPKCWTTTLSRDLDIGARQCVLVWSKRRWYCRCRDCPATSFTETLPQIPARARVTRRLLRSAGQAVCDGGRTVTQSGRDHGLSWPVVQAQFETAAAEVLPETAPATPILGIDEIRRGKARFVTDPDTGQIRQVVDRWLTGFVDLTGADGLLGQVDGRAGTDVGGWLAA